MTKKYMSVTHADPPRFADPSGMQERSFVMRGPQGGTHVHEMLFTFYRVGIVS